MRARLLAAALLFGIVLGYLSSCSYGNALQVRAYRHLLDSVEMKPPPRPGELRVAERLAPGDGSEIRERAWHSLEEGDASLLKPTLARLSAARDAALVLPTPGDQLDGLMAGWDLLDLLAKRLEDPALSPGEARQLLAYLEGAEGAAGWNAMIVARAARCAERAPSFAPYRTARCVGVTAGMHAAVEDESGTDSAHVLLLRGCREALGFGFAAGWLCDIESTHPAVALSLLRKTYLSKLARTEGALRIRAFGPPATGPVSEGSSRLPPLLIVPSDSE